MNKRLISVLVFAVLVAGVASLVLYLQIRSRMNTNSTARPTNQIVVATRQLEVGAVIKESDVKTVPWVGDLPRGALNDPALPLKRGVISTIYESEPVLESRLAPEGAGGGLAATIPKGMRAVGVKVDQVIGVAGFVVPGMRVDVVVAGNPGSSYSDRGAMSKLLLQNIEVLSAGQNMQRDAEGKPIQVQVVNLLVTPGQAEKLALVSSAASETRLQLVLRNPLDTDEVATDGVEYSSLFTSVSRPLHSGVEPRATRPAVRQRTALPPPPQPERVIEVIHGLDRSAKTIDVNTGEVK
jgi:pilus assembly protein CpaB